MMRKTMLSAVAALAIMATHAFAKSEAECVAAWAAADSKKAGVITPQDNPKYFAALRVGGKGLAAEKMTQQEFMANCTSGAFDVAANDPGAPLKGANSFTQAQAKDRALAHGLTDVTGLAKDADGIWRGKAMQNGKQVNVAVDYKGNVVAN